MSRFPLKQLTSLNISDLDAFPANGLRAFSQKITTLTSLTCSIIWTLNTSDLFLIAECFPLLEELDLSYHHPRNCSSYVDAVEALSLALIKLRKVNLTRFPINDQSLFHLFNNCKYLEEFIINLTCHEITYTGLASALRKRPTLRSLSFTIRNDNGVSNTSYFIDSFVSLKGLTCFSLHCSNISDELLYSIAREGLPLTRFVLLSCRGHSYAGIICLLSKCQRIQHLDLRYTDFMNDQHVVEFSSFLVDLVSINLSCCPNLTKSALFTLAKNCPSLSEIRMENIGRKIVGRSDSLVEFGVYPQLKSLFLGHNPWLSDEIITMFASSFPNLHLLDLNYCNHISEGICEVLRKCCKIRHLNLAYCWEVKLLGMNFVVPNLEVLNITCTKVDDETLYVISKNCFGLLQLLLEACNGITEEGVKHVLENCTLLRDHGYLLHTAKGAGVSKAWFGSDWFRGSDLFLIAEYFPLLEELDLSYPSGYTKYASYVDGVEALSLALIKLRKVNPSGFPINNQSLFYLFNNCKYLEEVIMFDCHKITSTGLAFALRQRLTLRSLSFSITPSNQEYIQMFTTSHFIISLLSLKGLTCLVLKWLHISNDLLYYIARESLPLTRLVLQNCFCHIYDGIFCLLTKCRRLEHLDLQGANFLNDQP
ncbi:F-box/LRR-repeat protein [Trifolium repens]|nr:F-box/LRR-repeat protein [Trifolium repens]